MDIKLKLINRSNNSDPSVVIFQKNTATYSDEPAIAWNVFKNLPQGSNHPFVFPMSIQAAASDSWGNYTPQLNVGIGQLYHVTQSQSGTTLGPAGAATSSKEFQLLNDLKNGAINAHIYKNGYLLAIKTSMAPGQIAVFSFNPTIWIGVSYQVVQGQVMDSTTISNINTELSLSGIASADIVITGGGPGVSSLPYTFSLENVVMQ
ncbi:hypothetical protein ACFGVR_04010 [Mucilaginibacter sp. AW1-3]